MSSRGRPLKFLGISGSLREGAHSELVLDNLRPLLPEGVSLERFRLHDVPLYNQDLDDTYRAERSPEAVVRLRQAVSLADGLVIASPEYNYGIPGVLKNALDWLSRPAFNSPIKGKPVLIVTSSMGSAGGARAQHQIRETLFAMLARPVVRMDIAIPAIQQSIAEGVLTDGMALGFLKQGLIDLVGEVGRRSEPQTD